MPFWCNLQLVDAARLFAGTIVHTQVVSRDTSSWSSSPMCELFIYSVFSYFIQQRPEVTPCDWQDVKTRKLTN